MQRTLLYLVVSASSLGLSACSDDDKDDRTELLNQPPAFLSGEVQHTRYDGSNNDLLTAGLGASGLAGAAPSFADSLNPTAEELRTLAIYNNYRALVDTSANGGYGTLFGPQVDAQSNEGRVAGDEYLAFMTVGDNGIVPVTAMVQIPASFDPANACMVTAPSSGSRGVYGAIGTSGEWGLKKGCAVVYTDKGSGTGADNMETGTAQRIDGTLTTDASEPAQFRTDLSAAERSAFNIDTPDRLAFKHAHSKVNPEALWGQHVLQSIQFGFYVLNEQFGEETPEGRHKIIVTPDNTLVIASSVSNGGGASVRAAEQDSDGLIDGIAVSEPNVNPTMDSSLSIRQGSQPAITGHSRSLFDYTTAIAVYQGCANLAANVRDDAPLNALNKAPVNENACATLAAKGLVAGADLDARAADAQRILEQNYGIQPEQNLVAPSHFGANVAQSIAMTYANAYGRFGVEDRLCGLSVAATNASDGSVMPLSAAQEASLFSASNGIPPTAGVNLVFDDAEGTPTNLPVSISPSSGLPDYGLDALLCLRSLAQNSDAVTGAALPVDAAANAARIADGIDEVRATGDLQGKPAIFVTGRADAILPINHTSRPYFGLNQKIEGSNSGLRYYEVLNAHHLDAFNAFPGFDARYVPLHRYYIQALDLMYDHLSNGSPLPPSQIVRTTPRGIGAPALTAVNVPPIAATPDAADRITFEDSQVRIPD